MKDVDSAFELEQFVFLKSALLGLVFLGIVLILSSDYLVDPTDSFKLVRLGLLAEVLALIAWLLARWRLEFSRWFTIVALTLVVFMGLLWLESNVFMALISTRSVPQKNQIIQSKGEIYNA